MLRTVLNLYKRFVKKHIEKMMLDNPFWIEFKIIAKKAFINESNSDIWKNEQKLISLAKQLELNDLYDEEFIGRLDPYVKNNKMNKHSSINKSIESIILNGTDPSPKFSQELYKEINEDVKSSGVSSILHYLEFGMKQERKYAKSKNSFPDNLYACHCKYINVSEHCKFLVIDVNKNWELGEDRNILELIIDCSEFKNHHKIFKIKDSKLELSDSRDLTYFLTCGSEAHARNQNMLITNEIEELVYIHDEMMSTKENISIFLASLTNRSIHNQNFINFWPENIEQAEQIIGYKLFRKNFILPNVYPKNTINSLFFADIPNTSSLVSNQREFNKTLVNELLSYEIDWASIGIKAKELQIRFVAALEDKTFTDSKLSSFNEAKYFRTREKINEEFSFELEKFPKINDYTTEYLKMNGNVSQVNLGASRKTIDLLNSLNMIQNLNLINILVWRLEEVQDCDVVLLSEEDLSNPNLYIKDKYKVVFIDTKNYSVNANSFDLEFMVNPRFNQYYDGTHYYRYNLKLTCESNNLKKLYYTLNIVFASRNLKVLDSFIDSSFSS